MAHLTARTVRNWYRLHKWTSLLCTALLLMACVTGLPLIFHEELDAMFIPEVRPATLPSNAPTASLDQMVVVAKQKFPSLYTYAVGYDDDEPRVFVTMSPSMDPKPEQFRSVIFDLHTGDVLETGFPGKGFMSWVLRLHSEIFMGLPGELLMGVMALLFLIALVSGALVYGPFMRRLDFGTYRKTGPSRMRWFDLHNLLGIVTLTWALVVGATGVMNALSTPLFGLWRAQAVPPLLAPYKGMPVPTHYGSLDEAIAHAASALPGMEITSVLYPNGIVGSPRHYVVWAKGRTPVTSRLFTPALVDAETGKITVTSGLPWYLRTLEICRPLHFGDYGGMPLKVIWALFDLAMIAVLASGVYLWLSKRRSPFENELVRMIETEEQGVAK